ncbi:MAG: transglycosylase domain-containing protein [Acidobacteria bacterium]|nr:transglycosylase domain-containing protein [Acidobacteriota bacterium]
MPAKARKRRRGGWLRWIVLAALAGAVALWGFFALAGSGARAVRALREDAGDAPIEVLAAPRVLRAGDAVDLRQVQRELASLGYRERSRPPREPGEYRVRGGTLEVYGRLHEAPGGRQAARFARVSAAAGRVESVRDASGRRLASFALEPVRLGVFRGAVLQERRWLPLDRFPERLVQSVLAAEDERFLRHRGVDFRAMLRAAWSDLTGSGPLQGASTITQQVIKQRVVGAERTLLRKLREAVLARYVEGRVGKDRILEIYLNEVYLGQRGPVSVVGMPAGALHYFGRDVRELRLEEAALLAGIIASPGRFSPRAHPEQARARRDWVLGRMALLGYIDRAEADAAAARPLELAPVAGPIDPAGDVLDAVQRELERRDAAPRPGTRPWFVHTSIDVAVQDAAREALEQTLRELESAVPSRRPLEGAVVAVDHRRGQIVALVGGRAGLRGGLNRALDAHRQPGSAFKPFAALAAFAEGGLLPSSMLQDEPLVVRMARGTWEPHNYDELYRGPVSIRQALEQSLNVPFARLALDVGPGPIAEWARRAGFEGQLPRQPSLALGTAEATPLEMATAYATLGALGVRRDPTLVRALGGTDLELAPAGADGIALPAADAWLVLDCLAGVVPAGTGRALAPAVRGVRVAAKTGTTQNGRDAWFALVTGRMAVVAWVGRDDSGPADLTGAGAALPVVRGLLERAGHLVLAPLPPPPPDVVEVEIDPATGGLALPRCPERVREVARAGELPPDCPEHRGFWGRLFDKFRRRDDRPPAGRRTAPGRSNQ